MQANKDHWQGTPGVDELIFQIHKDPSTMVQELVAGRIDAAHNTPPAEFTELESTPGIKAIAFVMFNWDYLCFNRCSGAGSLGDPVRKDPEFRVALDYAIDRDKPVSIAYGGYAVPVTTVLPPDNWQDPDFHWQPPAGVIQSQSAAKLIAGWFGDVNLDIQFEVVDEGVYNDRSWNHKGDTYAPDFDMYLWTWWGYADPAQRLDSCTTGQIAGWNEPCWSNLTFDRAYLLEARELDSQRRAAYVCDAQEAMYADNPQSLTVYPKLLQAVNTA